MQKIPCKGSFMQIYRVPAGAFCLFQAGLLVKRGIQNRVLPARDPPSELPVWGDFLRFSNCLRAAECRPV